MSRVAWVAGRLVAPDQPVLCLDDHGLVVGDGVFETVKVEGGVPFALRRHLARLARSAAGLGLGVPAGELDQAVAAVLAGDGAPDGPARLRITLTGGRSPLSSDRGAGPVSLVVALEPAPAPTPAAAVVLVPWTRNERGAAAGLKTTSYAENVIALRYAKERGGTEALFANTRGELCEGTSSNLFVAVGDRLVTPPLNSGCLAGVTRELLLEWVPEAEEGVLRPDDLEAAPEAFLASTLRDVQPIRSVDGRELPAAPGPLTRKAAEIFAGRAEEDPEP